ncbi:ABC1 kinase family protein [Thauera sp. Sel9]|uniref:ABC1 kinase family protein n=1 Tax=Thauera sp. Sel9 TaxID=2974299 RepID=UPI0021E179AE|nr:AarF/UbiB family protein [Thauera sp. Sel9]MCV2217155.1 AarF/UbiB family protein [Thauera sp. Sel9]
MFWQALTTMRDLGRLHEIASILVRYGFGDIVRRMGLANALERTGTALHWSEAADFAHMTPPERVRRALEDMGPAFVKLGQVLATRVDLLEPEWIAEFGKLQDSAPPAPWAAVHQQLSEDLGAPPEEIFAAFEPEPLAAGSIAQVHRARLDDGSEVVVKVRRPGIRPILEADLRWLARLAELAEAESPEWRVLHPREMVRQFAQSLRNELDFAGECRNADRIARNFAGYADQDSAAAVPGSGEPDSAGDPAIIVIPRVHWQWTGERVCVQEFIGGISGRRLQAIDQAGLDRKLLARRGANAVLKMIVEDGLFHADPHPGNVFYLPGNRIAFIDFGMVGRLSEERRDELIRLMLGLVKNDARSVVDVMLEWANDGAANEQELLLEIQSFVDRYHGVPLKQLRLSEMLTDLVAIPRRHHLVLPNDLALLVKAFVTLEGLGRELDPGFDIASQALPLLERAMQARYSPAALLKRGKQSATEVFSLLASLPQDLSRLLRLARRGRLEMHIDVPHLKRLGDQLDRAANRLVLGIVVAALIVGSSIVMTVPGGPTLLGLPVFGLVGFLGAMVGGVWLLLSILRSGKGP